MEGLALLHTGAQQGAGEPTAIVACSHDWKVDASYQLEFSCAGQGPQLLFSLASPWAAWAFSKHGSYIPTMSIPRDRKQMLLVLFLKALFRK